MRFLYYEIIKSRSIFINLMLLYLNKWMSVKNEILRKLVYYWLHDTVTQISIYIFILFSI